MTRVTLPSSASKMIAVFVPRPRSTCTSRQLCDALSVPSSNHLKNGALLSSSVLRERCLPAHVLARQPGPEAGVVGVGLLAQRLVGGHARDGGVLHHGRRRGKDVLFAHLGLAASALLAPAGGRRNVAQRADDALTLATDRHAAPLEFARLRGPPQRGSICSNLAHSMSLTDPTQTRLRPLPNLIFASRWLQLPLYLGLIVAQAVYVCAFLGRAVAPGRGRLRQPGRRCQRWSPASATRPTRRSTALNETIIMLVVLALIDVVMISNLLIMVIVGGYETFVSA